MIKITAEDFAKLVTILAKEGQPGASLEFSTTYEKLQVETYDRQNRRILLSLSSVDYPYKPTITRTETI